MVPLMSLVISMFFVFIFFLSKKHRQKNLLLPPGPPKLPLIGNMNLLMHPAPYRTLNDLAMKYGPIMHLKLGFVSTIVVSSAELAKQIMKTHDDVFCNRPKLTAQKILTNNYSDIAYAPYGTYWRQLKKICTVELSNAKIRDSSRFIREEEVKLLVESISKSVEPINLVERLVELNYNIITRITFGEKLDDELTFRMAVTEGAGSAVRFHIDDFFPTLGLVGKLTGRTKRLEKRKLKLSSIMDKKIQHHIEQRKVENNKPQRECLVDALLRLQETGGELDQPLTIDNIKPILIVTSFSFIQMLYFSILDESYRKTI
ncbi:hypothetical protein QVD17_15204 [Tagetes erecta]|uniref:Cytochrome P450 n=1 Tax=Tagetes erecta TaxID=13708 RepID=A0AAD8KNT5_TARER|nr:hypothetical protein QVD17_15204 [Tagetes erecta]